VSLVEGAAIVAGIASLCVIAPPAAAAATSDEPPRPAATDEAPAPSLVRVTLSKAAATFLTEGRVRRLIDLELPRSTHLASEAAGPLDENSVRVFIDLPEPGTIAIQVQAPQHKLEMRQVNVAGLAWDVAARVTAIAASESVRVQLAPVRKRPIRSREPTAAELDAALRRAPSVAISGALVGVALPALGGGLGGSRVRVGFHQPILSEELSLAAMAGDGNQGRMRWLELAIGAHHRIWLASSWRMSIGGLAGLANMRVERPIGAASTGPTSSFTMRAAATLGIEARLAPELWLGLDLEPGAILLDAPTGAQGAWLGASLGLSFDQPLGLNKSSSEESAARRPESAKLD
jgi:hypothetical protein